MGLNNLSLPVFVVAELYRESLVLPAQEILQKPNLPDSNIKKAETVVPEVLSPPAVGKNKKHILLLLDYASDIPGSDMKFLTGILTACKLSLDDVLVLNVHGKDVNYKSLTSSYRSKYIILFGVEASAISLPMIFPSFQPQLFSGTTYLTGPALHEMESDPLLKSKLWVTLKKIFNL
jgi:hypothetical protein